LEWGEAVEFAARKQRIEKQKLCHKRTPLAPGRTRVCGGAGAKAGSDCTKLIPTRARPPSNGAQAPASGRPAPTPRYTFAMSPVITARRERRARDRRPAYRPGQDER